MKNRRIKTVFCVLQILAEEFTALFWCLVCFDSGVILTKLILKFQKAGKAKLFGKSCQGWLRDAKILDKITDRVRSETVRELFDGFIDSSVSGSIGCHQGIHTGDDIHALTSLIIMIALNDDT